LNRSAAVELHGLNPSVTAVSDVPDMTGQKMAVGSRHRFPLEVTFRLQKAAAKLLNDAFLLSYVVKSRSCLGPTRQWYLALKTRDNYFVELSTIGQQSLPIGVR
jgi:hypothetical protein